MSRLVQVTTAIDSEAAARSIADALVDERLAACVQIVGPVASIYRWKGAVERATEWLCVAKTTDATVESVMARIRALHSYDQPEIVATPVLAVDRGYRDWLEAEVRPSG